MQQRKSDANVPAEMQLVTSSQENERYFSDMAPQAGARDGDIEVLSLEVLIQAVLNSNTEETEHKSISKGTITMKNSLKSGSIALGLGLMLTTLCYGQGYPPAGYYGPPHNVIYWNGDTTTGQLQTLVSSAYTDVIVNFVTADPNCNLSNNSFGAGANGGLPDDIGSSIQTLHAAGKTVLVSFGGQEVYDSSNNDLTSKGYQACYADILAGGNNLVQQLASIVTSNGFDGVDIDFEDDNGFQSAQGTQATYNGVDYLTKVTNNLYGALPQWQKIITHAPQTPYWTDAYSFAYANIVYNTNGNIAWFNNQTYNNCQAGSGDCTASGKIANYKSILAWVPPAKLVLGVPVSKRAASDGYLPFSSQDGNNMQAVISQLQQAYPIQFGGVMGWNYSLDVSDDNGNWSGEVLGALNSTQTTWVGYNPQTGLCLESNQGNVYANYCNGGNDQNWQFFVNTIRDSQTNFCLDSNDQGNVYADSCNGGNYQNWQFFGNVVRNRQTGLCLDISNVNDPNVPNGGVVYTDSCSGSATQNWWYAYGTSWPSNPPNPNE